MTASVPAVSSFAAALAPIAREVGVTLPPPQVWTDRIAAVDAVDVDVLTDGAARLRALADRVTAVAGAVGDVADDLPAAWHGVAGQRAHTVVAKVHRDCDETGHRLHTAAVATSAAARGIADLRAALHATLDAVPGLVLAGRAIADLTRIDLETNRAVIAAMVQVAVTTVETALTVTESAVAEVLSVLADSTGRLADPAQLSDRTDVVHDRRPAVDMAGVVGTLAGAGAATAAAVGMAAAGAAGVVAQMIDTSLDTEPSHPVPHPVPSDPEPSVAVRADPVSPPPSTARAEPAPEPTPQEAAPTGRRPHLNLRWDDEPDRRDAAPAVQPTPEDAPVGVPPAERDTPAAVTRSGPAAAPDPDDDGGLALAGDR